MYKRQVNEDLLENHRLLNELAHKLDPTRKTTMANVFMLDTTSPILEITDVNSYNLYFVWYLGELEKNDEFFDKYHADFPDRCIGFSEYGADANPQYLSLIHIFFLPMPGAPSQALQYSPSTARLGFAVRSMVSRFTAIRPNCMA